MATNLFFVEIFFTTFLLLLRRFDADKFLLEVSDAPTDDEVNRGCRR